MIFILIFVSVPTAIYIYIDHPSGVVSPHTYPFCILIVMPYLCFIAIPRKNQFDELTRVVLWQKYLA